MAPKCSWNPCDFILLLWVCVCVFLSVHTSFIYLTLPHHIRQNILTSSRVSTDSSNTTPFIHDGTVFIEFVKCLFKAESIFSCRQRPTLKSVMVLSCLLYRWHHVQVIELTEQPFIKLRKNSLQIKMKYSCVKAQLVFFIHYSLS